MFIFFRPEKLHNHPEMEDPVGGSSSQDDPRGPGKLQEMDYRRGSSDARRHPRCNRMKTYFLPLLRRVSSVGVALVHNRQACLSITVADPVWELLQAARPDAHLRSRTW